MFRLVLSIILALALPSASAASMLHGLSHDTSYAHQDHDVMDADLQMQSDSTLESCCKGAGGMASTSCLGDLAATAGTAAFLPKISTSHTMTQSSSLLAGLTPAVPTGPPKV